MMNMMNRMKKISAFLLTVLLLFSVTVASAGTIPSFLSDLNGNEPFRLTVHGTIGKIPPYSEDRTEKLNRLLRHYSFLAESDGNLSRNAVLMDGEELFSWMNEENPDQAVQDRSVQRYLDIWFSLYRYADLFQSIPDSLPDKAVTSKADTRYRDLGTAVRKEIYTLTAEEMTECLKAHLAGIGQTGFYPAISDMTFSGRQKITLQFREDGTLLRVNYNGSCSLFTDDVRNVTLDWKMLHQDTVEIDQLQLRTPAAGTSERDNLILNKEWRVQEDMTEKLTMTLETDQVHNRIRNQCKGTVNLLFENDTLSGTVTEKSTEQGHTSISEISGQIRIQPKNPLKGTLEITGKKDKIEITRYQVEFSLLLGSQISVPEHAAVLLPDSGQSAEQLERLLASVLVRAAFSLPEEDLAFLKEGIDQSLWDALLQYQSGQKEIEP